MSADAKIMEALLRIEHKVDMILASVALPEFVADQPKLGSPNHTCPLCEQKVQYHVDIANSVVVRKCGCSTGKIALDMGAFAPPALPAKKKVEDNAGDQEDRDDPDPRRNRARGR